MTRLSSHQQKQFVTRIIIYAVVLIALLAFLFTTGLRLLINATLFINGFGTKNEAVVTPIQKERIFGILTVDSAPSATNSAQFIASGSVTGFDTLDFYLNGAKVKETTPNSDYYSETIGDLQKGTNTFYVLAKSSQSTDQKQSSTITINYSDTKPKLDISQPADQSTTNQQQISVVGTTDAGIVVQMNDAPVVVDANGSFQTSLRLKDGDNTITVTASDDAGNTTKKAITVKYQKDQ